MLHLELQNPNVDSEQEAYIREQVCGPKVFLFIEPILEGFSQVCGGIEPCADSQTVEKNCLQ